MTPEQTLNIDGLDYPLSTLSDAAKSQLQMLHSIAKSAPGSGPEISAESFVAHAHKVA